MSGDRGPVAILAGRIFSFPVLLGLLLLLAVLVIARAFNVDADTWWHLVVGQGILRTHAWPAADPYSFSARGVNWMAYEWLADVLLALADRAFGLRGLMVLLFAWAGAITLLTYCYACLRCRSPRTAFLATAMTLPLLGVWFTLHPQLLGYIFLLITLICREHSRQGRTRAVWFLPLVFLLWVNTHGTFVFGFLALGIAWLCGLVEWRSGCLIAERLPPAPRRQLLLAIWASAMAGCVTPYGPRLLTYPLQMMIGQQEITAHMTSWQPIPLSIWHGKLFLAYVLLFVVAVMGLRPAVRLEDFTLFIFAVVMTALHARALPLFAIVFTPLLADLLKGRVGDAPPARDRPVLNGLLMAMAVCALIKLFPTRGELKECVAARAPVVAVEFLRRHPPPQPMLNELVFGGYLLYAPGLQQPVFIDGRLDIYQGAGVLADYLRLPSGAAFTLRKYSIQSCLLPPSAPLVAVLSASGDWRKVYGDGMSVVYVRKSATEKGPTRGGQ